MSAKLSEYNMAFDLINTGFLWPTFSPKNSLNMVYSKINTAPAVIMSGIANIAYSTPIKLGACLHLYKSGSTQ